MRRKEKNESSSSDRNRIIDEAGMAKTEKEKKQEQYMQNQRQNEIEGLSKENIKKNETKEESWSKIDSDSKATTEELEHAVEVPDNIETSKDITEMEEVQQWKKSTGEVKVKNLEKKHMEQEEASKVSSEETHNKNANKKGVEKNTRKGINATERGRVVNEGDKDPSSIKPSCNIECTKVQNETVHNRELDRNKEQSEKERINVEISWERKDEKEELTVNKSCAHYVETKALREGIEKNESQADDTKEEERNSEKNKKLLLNGNENKMEQESYHQDIETLKDSKEMDAVEKQEQEEVIERDHNEKKLNPKNKVTQLDKEAKKMLEQNNESNEENKKEQEEIMSQNNEAVNERKEIHEVPEKDHPRKMEEFQENSCNIEVQHNVVEQCEEQKKHLNVNKAELKVLQGLVNENEEALKDDQDNATLNEMENQKRDVAGNQEKLAQIKEISYADTKQQGMVEQNRETLEKKQESDKRNEKEQMKKIVEKEVNQQQNAMREDDKKRVETQIDSVDDIEQREDVKEDLANHQETVAKENNFVPKDKDEISRPCNKPRKIMSPSGSEGVRVSRNLRCRSSGRTATKTFSNDATPPEKSDIASPTTSENVTEVSTQAKECTDLSTESKSKSLRRPKPSEKKARLCSDVSGIDSTLSSHEYPEKRKANVQEENGDNCASESVKPRRGRSANCINTVSSVTKTQNDNTKEPASSSKALTEHVMCVQSQVSSLSGKETSQKTQANTKDDIRISDSQRAHKESGARRENDKPSNESSQRITGSSPTFTSHQKAISISVHSTDKCKSSKSVVRSLPTKSAIKSLPIKIVVKSLPTKSVIKSLPTKSVVKSLPVKSVVRSLPTKSVRAKSSLECSTKVLKSRSSKSSGKGSRKMTQSSSVSSKKTKGKAPSQIEQVLDKSPSSHKKVSIAFPNKEAFKLRPCSVCIERISTDIEVALQLGNTVKIDTETSVKSLALKLKLPSVDSSHDDADSAAVTGLQKEVADSVETASGGYFTEATNPSTHNSELNPDKLKGAADSRDESGQYNAQSNNSIDKDGYPCDIVEGSVAVYEENNTYDEKIQRELSKASSEAEKIPGKEALQSHELQGKDMLAEEKSDLVIENLEKGLYFDDSDSDSVEFIDLSSNSDEEEEDEYLASANPSSVTINNCLCHRCATIWNDEILSAIFRGDDSVTVDSRITYGAMICINSWVYRNRRLFRGNTEWAVRGIMERAGLGKNIKGLKLSYMNGWLLKLIAAKKISCCDVFERLYQPPSAKKRETVKKVITDLECPDERVVKKIMSSSSSPVSSTSKRVSSPQESKAQVVLNASLSCPITEPPVLNSGSSVDVSGVRSQAQDSSLCMMKETLSSESSEIIYDINQVTEIGANETVAESTDGCSSTDNTWSSPNIAASKGSLITSALYDEKDESVDATESVQETYAGEEKVCCPTQSPVLGMKAYPVVQSAIDSEQASTYVKSPVLGSRRKSFRESEMSVNLGKSVCNLFSDTSMPVDPKESFIPNAMKLIAPGPEICSKSLESNDSLRPDFMYDLPVLDLEADYLLDEDGLFKRKETVDSSCTPTSSSFYSATSNIMISGNQVVVKPVGTPTEGMMNPTSLNAKTPVSLLPTSSTLELGVQQTVLPESQNSIPVVSSHLEQTFTFKVSDSVSSTTATPVETPVHFDNSSSSKRPIQLNVQSQSQTAAEYLHPVDRCETFALRQFRKPKSTAITLPQNPQVQNEEQVYGQELSTSNEIPLLHSVVPKQNPVNEVPITEGSTPSCQVSQQAKLPVDKRCIVKQISDDMAYHQVLAAADIVHDASPIYHMPIQMQVPINQTPTQKQNSTDKVLVEKQMPDCESTSSEKTQMNFTSVWNQILEDAIALANDSVADETINQNRSQDVQLLRKEQLPVVEENSIQSGTPVHRVSIKTHIPVDRMSYQEQTVSQQIDDDKSPVQKHSSNYFASKQIEATGEPDIQQQIPDEIQQISSEKTEIQYRKLAGDINLQNQIVASRTEVPKELPVDETEIQNAIPVAKNEAKYMTQVSETQTGVRVPTLERQIISEIPVNMNRTQDENSVETRLLNKATGDETRMQNEVQVWKSQTQNEIPCNESQIHETSVDETQIEDKISLDGTKCKDKISLGGPESQGECSLDGTKSHAEELCDRSETQGEIPLDGAKTPDEIPTNVIRLQKQSVVDVTSEQKLICDDETEMQQEVSSDVTKILKEVSVDEMEDQKEISADETEICKEISVDEAKILKEVSVDETKIQREMLADESKIQREVSGDETETQKGLDDASKIQKEVSDDETETQKEVSDDEIRTQKEVSGDETQSLKQVSDDETETQKQVSGDETTTHKEVSDDETETQKEVPGDEIETQKEVSNDETKTQRQVLGDEKETQKEVSDDETETQKEVSDDETRTQKEVSGDETETLKDVSDDETETHKEVSGDETETQKEVSDGETKTQKEVSGDAIETQKEVSGDETETLNEVSDDETKIQKGVSADETEIQEGVSGDETEIQKEVSVETQNRKHVSVDEAKAKKEVSTDVIEIGKEDEAGMIKLHEEATANEMKIQSVDKIKIKKEVSAEVKRIQKKAAADETESQKLVSSDKASTRQQTSNNETIKRQVSGDEAKIEKQISVDEIQTPQKHIPTDKTENHKQTVVDNMPIIKKKVTDEKNILNEVSFDKVETIELSLPKKRKKERPRGGTKIERHIPLDKTKLQNTSCDTQIQKYISVTKSATKLETEEQISVKGTDKKQITVGEIEAQKQQLADVTKSVNETLTNQTPSQKETPINQLQSKERMSSIHKKLFSGGRNEKQSVEKQISADGIPLRESDEKEISIKKKKSLFQKKCLVDKSPKKRKALCNKTPSRKSKKLALERFEIIAAYASSSEEDIDIEDDGSDFADDMIFSDSDTEDEGRAHEEKERKEEKSKLYENKENKSCVPEKTEEECSLGEKCEEESKLFKNTKGKSNLGEENDEKSSLCEKLLLDVNTIVFCNLSTESKPLSNGVMANNPYKKYKNTLSYYTMLIERSLLSDHAREAFDLLPFEADNYRWAKEIKINKRFVTNREVLTLQSICIISPEMPDVNIFYKIFVQILLARKLVLLVPNSCTLLMLVEKLRRDYNRTKKKGSVIEFILQNWDIDGVYTADDLWVAKVEYPQKPRVRDILSVFCVWKNLGKCSSIDNFHLTMQKLCKNVDLSSTDKFGLCARLYARYCRHLFEENDIILTRSFLDLIFTDSDMFSCKEKRKSCVLLEKGQDVTNKVLDYKKQSVHEAARKCLLAETAAVCTPQPNTLNALHVEIDNFRDKMKEYKEANELLQRNIKVLNDRKEAIIDRIKDTEARELALELFQLQSRVTKSQLKRKLEDEEPVTANVGKVCKTEYDSRDVDTDTSVSSIRLPKFIGTVQRTLRELIFELLQKGLTIKQIRTAIPIVTTNVVGMEKLVLPSEKWIRNFAQSNGFEI